MAPRKKKAEPLKRPPRPDFRPPELTQTPLLERATGSLGELLKLEEQLKAPVAARPPSPTLADVKIDPEKPILDQWESLPKTLRHLLMEAILLNRQSDGINQGLYLAGLKLQQVVWLHSKESNFLLEKVGENRFHVALVERGNPEKIEYKLLSRWNNCTTKAVKVETGKDCTLISQDGRPAFIQKVELIRVTQF